VGRKERNGEMEGGGRGGRENMGGVTEEEELLRKKGMIESFFRNSDFG